MTRIIDLDYMWPGYSKPVDYHLRKKDRMDLRNRLSERQNHKCCYCGQRFIDDDKNRQMTIEHIVARASGGTDDEDNLVAACGWCNVLRGNRTLHSLLWILENNYWPTHVYGKFHLAKEFLSIVTRIYEKEFKIFSIHNI